MYLSSGLNLPNTRTQTFPFASIFLTSRHDRLYLPHSQSFTTFTTIKDEVYFLGIKKEKAVTIKPLLPCVYDSFNFYCGRPLSPYPFFLFPKMVFSCKPRTRLIFQVNTQNCFLQDQFYWSSGHLRYTQSYRSHRQDRLFRKDGFYHL